MLCLLLLASNLALSVPSALAERPIAFVVGIDTYDNLGQGEQLRKAVNDARAVAAALEGLGYDRPIDHVRCVTADRLIASGPKPWI